MLFRGLQLSKASYTPTLLFCIVFWCFNCQVSSIAYSSQGFNLSTSVPASLFFKVLFTFEADMQIAVNHCDIDRPSVATRD